MTWQAGERRVTFPYARQLATSSVLKIKDDGGTRLPADRHPGGATAGAAGRALHMRERLAL